MVPRGSFTPSDLATIDRAAILAESLTCNYFDLANDEWKRNPYSVYTRRELDSAWYEEGVFASVVRMRRRKAPETRSDEVFGIFLQDPNILRALLQTSQTDLWNLMLFVLTHELTHIVRFRTHGVDFFASVAARDAEEEVVHDITRKILSGVTAVETLVRLRESNPILENRLTNYS